MFVTEFGCKREDYWGGFLILKRITVDPEKLYVDPNNDLVMIKMRMFSSTHREGSLTFGNDDFLYLATSDQSAYSKPQNVTTNLDGGVLRLDVDQSTNKSYAPIRTLSENGRFSDETSGIDNSNAQLTYPDTGTYSISSGVILREATQSITLGTNFHAQAGSTYTARIVSNDGFKEVGNGDYDVTGIKTVAKLE
ncbi:MAG: hypothetical protein ACI9SG_002119 [Maribacter sp.]